MCPDAAIDLYAPPRAEVGDEQRPTAVLASPVRRLAAYIVNQLAIAVSLVAGLLLLESQGGGVSFEGGPDAFVDGLIENPRLLGRFIAPSLLLIVVQLVMLARSSTTIGKALFGLRIVRRDGRRAALWRLVVLRLLVLAIGATLLDELTLVAGSIVYGFVDPLMIFTQHHRTLHDRIADTIVVRTR